ncbi:hypothetical protein W822_21980 [Advenella kashmirensis W13003]|uniref:Uncharacterized protein n=1 Tax=Advenella kashmirensis W13003 TaxID=1424334 RepID=V8QML7_9BURK|nr:hypothetical protein W822_21980 [Advenella kashmirensis W13003]
MFFSQVSDDSKQAQAGMEIQHTHDQISCEEIYLSRVLHAQEFVLDSGS